jgi:hypothetical protein
MYVKQTEILQTKKNIEQGKGAGKLRVGIVWLGYMLDDREIGIRFLAGARYFSLLLNVQTDSVAHPASYIMRTVSCFLGGNTAGAWSWPFSSN